MLSCNCYPLIYKKKVVSNYENREDTKIIKFIKQFGISNGSLYNWINKNKDNCLIEKQKYNKPSKYTPVIRCYIRTYVLRNKIFDYKKLIKLILKKFNIQSSKTSIYDIIKSLNLTRKRIKKRLFNGNQKKHKDNINNFKKTIKTIKLSDIISIDETSVDTRIIPVYGWSVKGKKLEMKIKAVKKRYTVICAINNTHVIHYEIILGSANAETFKHFLVELDKKVTNKYLLLDNARIHHSKIVKEYITQSTNKLLFNVPYTPEFNPIEHVFSIIKNTIKKAKNNGNANNLKLNIYRSLNKISEKCINNCYNKSLTF